MKSASILTFLALFATGAIAQTPLSITVPEPVEQCQLELLIRLGGGTPPYVISIHEAAPPYTEIDSFNTPVVNFIWGQVQIQSGTTVFFKVTDSTSASEQTDDITIGGAAEPWPCPWPQ